jgi:hypothetical protein
MKKVWKWIIGIVIGLVVLAVLVGVVFMLRGGFHAGRIEARSERGWSVHAPGMMPYGGFGWHMRGPGMMYNNGIIPFGGLFGGLITLGFMALIVLGIIWLVRILRTPKRVDDTAAAMPATLMTTCKNCGKPIQADWRNCPYCGKKV